MDDNSVIVPLSPVEEREAARTEEDEIDAKYSVDSLAAIVKPVMITMILASLAVLYVRDASTDSTVSSGLSSYLVYQDNSGGGSSAGAGGGEPSSSEIGQALVNALVIVGVVCGATFVLVACYYFRCLKLMIGYLTFAMASLLGYSGGFLVLTAIQVWQIPVDWVTFVLVMYNFAIVGVWSIMLGKGTPVILGQAYLVCVSVIMAWVLTKLPEWTSWTLLVMLALYDLCAVLTPCGPLKWLVNLAQERRDPLPGLLYDSGAGREGIPAQVSAVQGAGTASAVGAATSAAAAPLAFTAESLPGPSTGAGATVVQNPARADYVVLPGRSPPSSLPKAHGVPDSNGSPHVRDWPGDTMHASAHTLSINAPAVGADGGGPEHERARGPREEAADEQEEEQGGIKLGLGDFVFYSVLVSRAALYDASTLAACFVSVVVGLAGTLFLLSIARKALPALPISIFLGVTVYVCTRYAVTPMLAELMLNV